MHGLLVSAQAGADPSYLYYDDGMRIDRTVSVERVAVLIIIYNSDCCADLRCQKHARELIDRSSRNDGGMGSTKRPTQPRILELPEIGAGRHFHSYAIVTDVPF